jgi:hypothetical protein
VFERLKGARRLANELGNEGPVGNSRARAGHGAKLIKDRASARKREGWAGSVSGREGVGDSEGRRERPQGGGGRYRAGGLVRVGSGQEGSPSVEERWQRPRGGCEYGECVAKPCHPRGARGTKDREQLVVVSAALPEAGPGGRRIMWRGRRASRDSGCRSAWVGGNTRGGGRQCAEARFRRGCC